MHLQAAEKGVFLQRRGGSVIIYINPLTPSDKLIIKEALTSTFLQIPLGAPLDK
jgi:hypothetical protein